MANQIFQQTGFPFAWGFIDGTHIEIMRPTGSMVSGNLTPENFINRKGYYSLNVLAVCDNELKIRYFSARHAGSAHDSRIFEDSNFRQYLQEIHNSEEPRVLLGDEGFACSDVNFKKSRCFIKIAHCSHLFIFF